MNELTDPATRDDTIRAHVFAVSPPVGGSRAGCQSLNEPQFQSANRSADSGGARSRPARQRRSGTERDLELHQPVHALWKASRFQRQFHGVAARARSESARAALRNRKGERGRGGIHADSGRLAILRSGARRQHDSSLQPRGRQRAGFVPVRQTAEIRWPVPQRLHSGSASEDRRDHLGLFVVRRERVSADTRKRPNSAANSCWRIRCRRWR